jgi:Domain of unknown function (DUF4375)
MHWFKAGREYRYRLPDGAGLSALASDWQREMVALVLASDDINNGGYLQFFVNRGREVVEWAHRAHVAVGANRMAEIIASCQALIDEHAPPEAAANPDLLFPNPLLARDGSELKPAGSVLPDAILARISELSREFVFSPDDFDTAAQARYEPLFSADGTA